MQLRTLVTLAVALLSLAPVARAQCSGCPSGQSGDIKVVRIDSNGAGTPETIQCGSAGTDLTINLANWSWSPDNWVIHVFDCDSATTPTHNIGHVTVTGNPANIGLLAVFVGGAAESWSDIPPSQSAKAVSTSAGSPSAAKVCGHAPARRSPFRAT